MSFNMGRNSKRVTSGEDAEEHRRNMRLKRYSRIRIDGTCHDCGEKTEGECRCPKCKLANAARMTAKRAESDAKGLCSYCHVEPREPGITKCRPCADYCNQARVRSRQEKKVCECGHLIGNRALSCVKCRHKHGK